MLGSSMGMVPELHPDVQGVRKKFQLTNFTMSNNISSMKYTLKSVPGLADVGVLHGKAAQCIVKEILISKNGTIDIDTDNRMF